MTHLNPRPRTHALSRLCLFASGLVLLLGLAQPAWAAAPFTVNSDATVTDSTTRLVWDQCAYGLTDAACGTSTALAVNWAGALDAAVAANAASYKGFSDWRVPNINELESIVKLDTSSPAIDATAFPGTLSYTFWTSTSDASDATKAMFVYFDRGEIAVGFKAYTLNVRLVRSGQNFAGFDGVPPASQTITFANPGTQNAGTTLTLTATASSGLTPTFTSSTTGVCTITSGGGLTVLTSGTCTIAADQAGNGSYYAAPQVRQSFAVNRVSQTITFANPGTQTFGITSTLTATASSGLTPTFTSSTTGVCTITSGGGLTLLTGGTCSINADQAGNGSYNAAPQVRQSFAVNQMSQSITFANPGTQTLGTTPTLTATASSGLTPTFTSSTTGVCTIASGGGLTLLTSGNCSINADQAGNGGYSAAPQVRQSFAVNPVYGLLNDTGQTQCDDGNNVMAACTVGNTGDAATYKGQDGRFGRDPAAPAKVGGGVGGFDFTKVCFNGAVEGTTTGANTCTGTLVANNTDTATGTASTDWACTKDNVTNLIWSLQSGYGDWTTYARTTLPGTTNTANRCGFNTGWRLPTRRELLSIVLLDVIQDPTLDVNYFPGTVTYNYSTGVLNEYWTSEATAYYPDLAWVVWFFNASPDVGTMTYASYVRLVRSGQ